jgi:hypothetical protein
VAAILRVNGTPAAAELLAPALLGAAAALALAPPDDPGRAAAALGEAFATVLVRSSGGDEPERVQTVGLY